MLRAGSSRSYGGRFDPHCSTGAGAAVRKPNAASLSAGRIEVDPLDRQPVSAAIGLAGEFSEFKPDLSN